MPTHAKTGPTWASSKEPFILENNVFGISERKSAKKHFLNKPIMNRKDPIDTSYAKLRFLVPINSTCGPSSAVLTIGPAMRCGKKRTIEV